MYCIVLHNHCKTANQKTPDQNGYRLHCSQLSAAIPELFSIESFPCNQMSLSRDRFLEDVSRSVVLIVRLKFHDAPYFPFILPL
ncbi:hypothetical protein EYC80_004725 [Monilinia laxa]|uniref:Uncharacterized protein n=1 Tax=Monilinia laxa TaxID=61186 RepID=A0A5N6KHM2_MONLA|nr:hypothetical protein EYC80_004725 [Monilinia laxa]